MNEINKTKAFFTVVFASISSFLGTLTVPVLLLVACNVIDYITGLFAAPKRGESISSNVGISGIIKKVCMWLLVVVGAIIDELIKYAVATTGITIPFSFLIACVVAVWLVCNELISILENVGDIGVPLPDFLVTIVQYIKKQAEEKTDFGEEDDGDE